MTPGFEKTDELTKKLGMDEVVVVDALGTTDEGAVASGAFTGAGLGGTREIDGTEGNIGAAGAMFVTSGVFGRDG